MTAGEKIRARWEPTAADKGKCPTDGGILKRLNPRSRKKTVSADRALFCGGGLWPDGFWHTIAVRKEMQNVLRMPGRCSNEKTAAETGRREENKGVQEI